MYIAASAGSARRAMRPAAILVIAALGGCAGNGQLLAPAGSGTIQVWTGDKVTPWPAQFVTWNHPANAEAMPFSKSLWDAGFKIPENHCYLIDGTGAPTQLTVFGTWHAASNGKAVGRIGEFITPGELAAARNNFNRVQKLYAEAVWKASGGSPSQIEAMLRDAVKHDAACLRLERLWIQRRVQLLHEFKAPVRDLDGRPGIATINRQDPNLRGDVRQGIQVLEGHNELIKNTIRTYGFIAQDLTRRVAATRGTIATAPDRPVRRPPALPAPSRPGADKPPRAAPVRSKPASRPDDARPLLPPASASPSRIVIDTTPLQRESDATLAALAKARQFCLGKAVIDCS